MLTFKTLVKVTKASINHIVFEKKSDEAKEANKQRINFNLQKKYFALYF